MNPSKVQARKMVLVSAFLLAAIAVYRDHRAGAGDTFRALWGVGVVSLLLALAADFVPRIAGPFAGLVVLGSLTGPGSNLIQNALGKVAATQPSAPASPGPSAPPGPVGPRTAPAPRNGQPAPVQSHGPVGGPQ